MAVATGRLQLHLFGLKSSTISHYTLVSKAMQATPSPSQILLPCNAGAGGIFISEDIGRTFTRVGAPSSAACTNDMINDFLAVAYDTDGGYL